MGPGSHLAKIIKRWLRLKSDGCGGCQATLEEMDRQGTAWCRKHLRHLVAQVRTNARKAPEWRARILVRIPGAQRPIRAMILRAIELSERDLTQEKKLP